MSPFEHLPAELTGLALHRATSWGSDRMDRTVERIPPRHRNGRQRCRCGCRGRNTHFGYAGGVVLTSGCHLYVARWAKTGRT